MRLYYIPRSQSVLFALEVIESLAIPGSDEEFLERGWQARLNLGFVRVDRHTALKRRERYGPLLVQKPFYPEAGGVCHVYILHPPGGLVGGDDLKIDVDVGPGAHALITTPAAGKIYRSAGLDVRLEQRIKIAPGGTMEWLPSENIFFSGAKARIKTRVELFADSRFIGWDIGCLGRPACNELFQDGVVDQRFEIWQDETPLHIERLFIKGGDSFLDAKWGLASRPVIANVICVTSRHDLLDSLRSISVPSRGAELSSATCVDGAVLCRFLGENVEQARQYLVAAWKILRCGVLGVKAVEPRIWST